METKGFVYIAGSGPGNKDYITVKAYEVLQNCDCVIYDALIDQELLSHTKVGCEKIYVGKMAGKHYASQDEINDLIIQKAHTHQVVLRLKGGDPFVFGRGGEEAEALIKAGIDFELIPGVTSAVAVPEMAGIPVTHRGVSRQVSIITGHVKEGTIDQHVNFQALAQSSGTLVFLMGLHALPIIVSSLLSAGQEASTPCAIISNGTKESEHVLRASLGDIEEKAQSDPLCVTPAIIVVGETSRYDFRSQAQRPLSHTTVSIVGTIDFNTRMGTLVKRYGAHCHSYPIVKIQPVHQETLEEKIAHLQDYTMLVFTSRNTIRLFFETFYEKGYDLRLLSSLKIAVIDEATAMYLKDYHFNADYIPDVYTSQALGELLTKVTTTQDRLLIPRALKGNDVLSTILSAAHRSFDEFALYDTVIDFPHPGLCEDDYLIFASSQGLKGYFEAGGQVSDHTQVICIGPYTAKMATRYPINHWILAQEASRQGILATLLEGVQHAKI